ncbi:heptaprenyl diphosphate synthase component 1 [Paenibacillus pasadenensis]|uniref:heptaprenyl diphosphate synthase component 1 n=1 Tax=Paenibacillus pasadenensis TaxID=217090 RepID=UPI00203D2827|nr:heptaprenyl diphosphate synthase component 1 [Paenibacillus pasadenensis]MCM3747401.1 heptaprenyl diphosphate synthase component 1 [Paenibacillus pasadenensis]
MTEYRIPALASKYTKHDMIQRYADLPPFPDARIRLLHRFLQHGSSLEQDELQSLAVSLVQLGLDTHDFVDIEAGDRDMFQMRQRQLRVLAGDYFSSRFYQLLAGAGNIDLIRTLSGAICEANRLKTELYLRMKKRRIGAEEYVELQSRIRAVLFLGFSEVLEEGLKSVWEELVMAISKLEVLAAERLKLEQAGQFGGSWGYWYVLEHGDSRDRTLLEGEPENKSCPLIEKYGLAALLADKLGSCAARYRQLSASLAPSKLAEEAAMIADLLLRPSRGVAAGTAGESR